MANDNDQFKSARGPICADCRFWVGWFDREDIPTNEWLMTKGYCRRRAPQIFGKTISGAWPSTGAGDFCGEYKPAGQGG